MLLLPLKSLSQEADTVYTEPSGQLIQQYEPTDRLDTLQESMQVQLIMLLEILNGLNIKKVDSLDYEQ